MVIDKDHPLISKCVGCIRPYMCHHYISTDGDVIINESIVFNKPITSKSLIINADVIFTGATVVKDNLTSNNGLIAMNQVTVGGTLDVTGDVKVGKFYYHQTRFVQQDNFEDGDDVIVGGTMRVRGDVWIQAGLYVGGALHVDKLMARRVQVSTRR